VAASRWWGWGLPLSKEHLLNLGQFGPFASAILLTALGTGRAGLRRLLSRLVLWRVSPAWYGVALALPPLTLLTAIRANALISGQTSTSAPVDFLSDVIPNFLFVLLLGGPLGEELGWRGYALPRLERRWGRLVGSLVLGVGWACWHFPIWLAVGSFTLPAFGLYIVGTIPLTLLFTWLSSRARGSVLIAMVFHGSLNTSWIKLPIEPAFPIWVVLLWVLALSVVAADPLAWLVPQPDEISLREAQL